MIQYLQVAENEDDNSPIELPSEDDGTLLLTTLAAQFPGASGLKYKAETGNLRGLRLSDGRLHAPDEVWGSSIYYVVYPKVDNKRKADDNLEDTIAKVKRAAVEKKCSDLIVLGLAYTCEKEDLETFFSEFGTLTMVEIKKDPRTNKHKGFGFIRFAEYEAQVKAMSRRHHIQNRWCDVKIPNSKEGGGDQPLSRKIFVGRCTEDMTTDVLRAYFEKFGEVTDVFIPQPFRAFAFVSFTDPHIATALCGEDHVINNVSCNVSSAVPKGTRERLEQQRNATRGGSSSNYQRSSYGSGSGGWNSGSQNGSYSSNTNSWAPSRPAMNTMAGPPPSMPPPVPPPAAPMNQAMMEQMSTIMAAALAASQNMFQQQPQQQASQSQAPAQAPAAQPQAAAPSASTAQGYSSTQARWGA